MNQNTVTGWTLFTLLASSLVLNVIAYPQVCFSNCFSDEKLLKLIPRPTGNK